MDNRSRMNKYEKRRTNKKRIFLLISLAVLVIIVWGGTKLLTGGSQEASKEQGGNENLQINEDGDSQTDTADSNQTEKKDDDTNSNDTDHDSGNKEKVDSDDSNVSEAYKGDWKPAGTNQTGPHTTNYNDNSDDRKEIKHAAAAATGLKEDSLTTFWVGNAGDSQKVTTTIYDDDQTNIYRVGLSWVEEKGWQVTKIEKLKSLAH